jgi:hypothetical protein
MRENEAAKNLSKIGYDVEQNPARPPNATTNPDYKIEGRYFDAYSPKDADLNQIWSNIEDKVSKRQAQRIVLNLDDSPHSATSVSRMFEEHNMASLQELMILRGGQVMRVFLGAKMR